MTCHYPVLGNASYWLCWGGNLFQPVRSITHIWGVTDTVISIEFLCLFLRPQHTCQLSRFSRLEFFTKSHGFLVRAPNLLGNTYRGLSQNYSLNFIIFKMSKRKINGKWIWCTSIGKIKTEQSSWHTIYLMSDCRNWSEINQSDWTIHGRKLAQFSHAFLDVGNIRKAFRWFLEIIQTLSKMILIRCKDFKMSPGFCTLGVGRYVSGKQAVAVQNLSCFLKPQYLHKLSVNNVLADTTGITTPCIQTASSKEGNFGQCFWKA